MKSILKLIIVSAVIFLLSAFLAPILFKFLPFKFERIFYRLVMIGFIGASILFLRFNRETFVRYGLNWTKRSPKDFLIPFLTSMIVLALFVGVRISVGNAVWSPQGLSVGEWAFVVIESLGAGLLIGVIEEFFFRGFLFLNLKDRFRGSLVASVAITSIFYAVVHFLRSDGPFIGPEPTMRDSFLLMNAPMDSFVRNWSSNWPGVVGLFIFGVMLNSLFIQTKSLYPAIGLHAGCVFFIKMDGHFVDILNNRPLLFGTQNLYDGLWGWIVLSLLGIGLTVYFKRNQFLQSARG